MFMGNFKKFSYINWEVLGILEWEVGRGTIFVLLFIPQYQF